MSSGKIGKYLTGEEILPSNRKQIKEQANVIYSPLIKAFQKQTRAIFKNIFNNELDKGEELAIKVNCNWK